MGVKVKGFIETCKQKRHFFINFTKKRPFFVQRPREIHQNLNNQAPVRQCRRTCLPLLKELHAKPCYKNKIKPPAIRNHPGKCVFLYPDNMIISKNKNHGRKNKSHSMGRRASVYSYFYGHQHSLFRPFQCIPRSKVQSRIQPMGKHLWSLFTPLCATFRNADGHVAARQTRNRAILP